MPEVTEVVRKNPELYDAFNSEEEAELLQELEEQRSLQQTGIRANNVASEQVARTTVKKIGTMVGFEST